MEPHTFSPSSWRRFTKVVVTGSMVSFRRWWSYPTSKSKEDPNFIRTINETGFLNISQCNPSLFTLWRWNIQQQRLPTKTHFSFHEKIYNIHFRNANKHLYFNAGNSTNIEHGSALSLDHTLNFQFRVLFLLLYNDNCSIKIIERFAFSLLQ